MIAEGSEVGKYRIISEIGQGGMGHVYKACDTATNREVALKVLPVEFA
jgi:serine/threonine protein kinase